MSDDTTTNGDDSDNGADGSADDASEQSDGEDEALEVLDAFWEALISGDRETGQSVVSEEAPLREESWWDEPWEDLAEQGIDVDVIDREVVDASDERYVVVRQIEWDVPGEPPEIVTDEVILRVEDEGTFVWDMDEVESETVHEGESTRLITLDVAADLDAELAFELSETVIEGALMEIDGVPTIVLDPHGDPFYNADARSRFDAFLIITNAGDTSIDRLVADMSVSGTENDDAHEAAIRFIRNGDAVPLDGEANVLAQSLKPDESATLGLELDLMDSGISDIEEEATMEIVFKRG